MKKTFFALLMALTVASSNVMAQSNLTREQIMQMSIEELSDLPLEDLMQAVETLGVSSVDELFALIMNKNVSSASKNEESSFTSPLSSTVITRDEMRTYGVTTIEEAFRLIPGMIVSEKTNGVYDVQMRGLNNIPDNNLFVYTENMNILLMIDGRICHNYATGAAYFETLPISIEDVERIEVVRGATSAMYGPNAVNGVVNIITTKPDQSNDMVSGSVQGGNYTLVADVAFRKSFGDKFSFGISANTQQRNRRTSKAPFIPQEDYYLFDESIADQSSLTAEEYATYLASGLITEISSTEPTYFSVDEIDRIRLASSTSTDDDGNIESIGFSEILTGGSTAVDEFEHVRRARQNYGVNGYFTLVPNTKMRFDLSGGYNYVLTKNTPANFDDFALRDRENKTYYVNLNSSIYGLSFLANYSDGKQDFCVGTYGFSLDKSSTFNVQAEYDFKVGDLSILPGVSYQYIKYECGDATYVTESDGTQKELSNFFGYVSRGENSAKLTDIAPYLRLDYKHDALRLIGAIRADKTNMPDKWNVSGQVSASYGINDNNFVRLVYGHSFRSATFMNTSVNYEWELTEGRTPNVISFEGNEESPLVHIDNFEVGYRFRPVSNLLLDFEGFYSYSTDYGAHKSSQSMIAVSNTTLNAYFQAMMSGTFDYASMASADGSTFETRSVISYDSMPFKVNQFGLSLNVDWAVARNLMIKANLNLQQTKINNYYRYSQSEMITRQLTESYSTTMSNLFPLITEVMTGVYTAIASGSSAEEYLDACLGYTPVAVAQAKYVLMTEDEQQAYLDALYEAYENGTSYDGNDRPLGLYYALKYNVNYDREAGLYYFGTTVAEPYTTSDGHKHKATPSFYGSLGAIYKPIDKMDVALTANYIGKREYTTTYGTREIDPVFTVNLKVGYKPIDICEVFINAHNLFHSDKREFLYTDKIGGIYTVGVNFNL